MAHNIFSLVAKVGSKLVDQLAKLRGTNDVTLCGEAGEYHTLVVDGPIFQERLEIRETGKVLRDNHWFLEISGIGKRE